MTERVPWSPHDVSPEAAIAAIRAFRGPLLVDLDETLYLRNSTEDFIDTARPRAIAAVSMKILEWIKPWRWTGGHATRDVWRVRLVMMLFPWTAARWRRRVPQLVERFANEPLVNALRTHSSRPIIVTLGFRPIVAPLVAAFELGDLRIVASRVCRFGDRLQGKLILTLAALGEETVRQGMAVTDSTDDLPLLDACAYPLRTVWAGACYRCALGDIYLPGRYLSRVKRPGERYIVRSILQEDFALWLLSSIALAAFPLRHAAGLFLLLLSFWTIYECGYADNDRVAACHESDPHLSAVFHETPIATPRYEPWIWASVFGVIAIFLVRWPATPEPMDFAKWFGVLLATHGWFRVYNRVDKLTRIWLYAGLQFARSAAFAVLVPVVALGAIVLGAHVLAKWMPYYVYRVGGREWPKAPMPLVRLLFVVVMALMLVLTQGPSAVMNWTGAALLAWSVFRARTELRAAVMNARRIDRSERQ